MFGDIRVRPLRVADAAHGEHRVFNPRPRVRCQASKKSDIVLVVPSTNFRMHLNGVADRKRERFVCEIVPIQFCPIMPGS